MGVARCVVSCLLAVLAALPAAAQETLSLREVLDRAALRSPEVLAARARVDEARGRLTAASVRFRDNPVLELGLGPRFGANETSLDIAASIAQTFETGGQRASRIAAAESAIARELAESEEALRRVLHDLAAAFVRGLVAQDRTALLRANETFAENLRTATVRRYDAGDVSAIDLNLTQAGAARARAARQAAEADVIEALRPIRLALGLDGSSPSPALAGSLEHQAPVLAELQRAAREGPALRALAAAIAEAEAEVRLATGTSKPDLSARVSFEREATDRTILGGIGIAWPAFDSGQGARATATARIRRLTLEREAMERALNLDLTVGWSAYQLRAASAATLRDAALPAAADNETLAERSYDAGEMNLLELLLVRQEATSARLAYLDALGEAAMAAINLEARAGSLR